MEKPLTGPVSLFTVALLPFLALVAAERGVDAGPTPGDLRIAPDLSNAGVLVNYDSVAVPATPVISYPYGEISFDSGQPAGVGYRLWFLDSGLKHTLWNPGTPFLEGRQLIGKLDTNISGGYNMSGGNGFYGDKGSTKTIDEGAQGGEAMTLLAQDISTGRIVIASFTSGPMMSGYTPTDQRCDIQLTNRMLSFNPAPTDWTLDLPCMTKLSQLNDKDGLSQLVTGTSKIEKPYGALLESTGTLAPEGDQIWGFWNGKPVLYTETTDNGKYRLDILGDDPSTPSIIEGLPIGASMDDIQLLVRGSDLWYFAGFASPLGTFDGDGSLINVGINIDGVAPEPATVALMALGAASLLLKRRRRE